MEEFKKIEFTCYKLISEDGKTKEYEFTFAFTFAKQFENTNWKEEVELSQDLRDYKENYALRLKLNRSEKLIRIYILVDSFQKSRSKLNSYS